MDDLREKLNTIGGDLFKDLRDRRLLPVVALLVVAIVAVPLLIGGGGGEEPEAPLPLNSEVPAGAEELEAVVLAAGDGVRDYRKRVDGRPRNPFKQQYPGLKQASADDASDAAADGASAGEGSLDSGGSGDIGGISAPPGSSDAGTTSPPADQPPAPPAGDDRKPKKVTKLIRMTVDVRISHAGKKRDIKGVEPLSLVPGDKSPITQYTGASRDAKQASFVVSAAVGSTEGDGNCMPGRNNCQFLILKPGESQYFHYGEKAKRYRLKLLAINRVVERVKDSDGAGAGKSGGSDGASAAEIG